MASVEQAREGGLERFGVPVWLANDGNVAPMNAPAREWIESSGWPGLSRLMRALLRVPGLATGSYEWEGMVYQILTIDGEDGPLVLMRPIRPGENEGEVERRLAEIVHDLNAPITSLRLRLGNLRQSRAEDERLLRELLSADRELSRLQGIVRDAAALGRLSAHLLRQTDTNASALLESISSTLSPLAHSCGVQLQIQAAPGAIRADRPWIERALTNLGDNAIRHSPHGDTVTITAEASGDGWRLRVSDRGRGISPEALSGTLLGRGEEPRGLAGLGLTLVRRIVAAHSGRLEVASEEGVGSTFTLELPGSFVDSPSHSEPRHPK